MSASIPTIMREPLPFYDVWSAGNGVKKLPRKSNAWLNELMTYLEQPFFSRYAQYASLEAMINPEDTPDLYRRLAVFDELRRNLLIFLSKLLHQPRILEKIGSGIISA